MDNNTAKGIGLLILGVIGIYIFMTVLPYLVMFLALYGGWHLYQEHNKKGRF